MKGRYMNCRIAIFAFAFAALAEKSVSGAAGVDLPQEEPYDFRKRLSVVHEENRKDASAVPGEDEFAFLDGAGVALAADAPALARRAAGDFLEYLAVSMGVKTGETAAVSVAFDKGLGKGHYTVEVGDAVAITAFDARAAAQALYHLEDAMNMRRAPFLAKGRETRGARFSPRLAHSGFKCDVFPDEHLRALSHAGIDAILIYLGAPGLCKVEHRNDVRDTMQRALAWGIDTYIYSQVNGWKHPDDPDAEKFFDSRYGKLVAAYPEAKGFVVVDENCRFPSKDPRVAAWDEKTRKPIDPNDPRPAPGYFPSSDYPAWFGRIRSAINKVNPDVELVFWAYAFCWQPIENAVGFVDILPKDVTLNVTFEMAGAHEKRNGMKSVVEDYSLSFEGPGQYFRAMAAAARRNGLRLYTMANSAGLAWDWGTIPYEPCPYQWKRRWDGVVAARGDYGVAGVMESHHYGVWPSFITELEKEAYTDGGYPFDWHIRKIAERDFGKENADAALEAWRSLSDAVRDVPPTYENQYGPFRIGPAFPFCAFRPTLDVSKLPFKPMYLGRYWQQMRSRIYAPNDWLGRDHDKADYINRELELLRGVADRFLAAGRTFRSIAEDVVLDPARRAKAMRLSYLTEYMGRGALTALHTREAVWLEHGVKHLGVKGEEERRARARVDEIARAEYENTLAALEIMKRDSRLGWEPTMDYRGGIKTLEWKLGYILENYPVK